ncbi:Hypothetical protein PHPALM_17913 [Phytophthora palmivora]|uniref:Uncharacterized protein n=1 Tax=Phytophthora palmivora TaxID=4796 RepID=A0A2P4XL20_9STRA|nr:Hypothetical protein PHPALM_17913 [Phytophthora palmivora]
MASDLVTIRRLRLEQLQRLCDEGKREALQSIIATYSTKELRTLCGGFGVPAQSKEYAAYQSKAGYSELLVKLLDAKTASNAGAEFVPMTSTASGRTRKTKNCNLRLINVLFSPTMAPYLADLGDEATRKKRTVDGISPFWEKVRTEFMSRKQEYAWIRYPDDQVFADFNLASPVAHSGEKLQKMWEKLGLAYASVFSQFSDEKNCDADLSACAGRIDVYYLRRWLSDKPELLSVVVKASRDTDVGQQTRTYLTKKEDEGERLMKSIKLAYEVLAVMPAADRGSEIEHTIRRRVHRYSKRLKTLEDAEDRLSMNL